jgi:hypothetical protein
VSDFRNSSALLVLNGSFGQANRRQWRWIRCEFFEFFAFFVENYFVIGAGIGCGFGLGWGFGGICFNVTFPSLTLSFEGSNLGVLGLGFGGGCGVGFGFGWGYGVGWGSKYIDQNISFKK